MRKLTLLCAQACHLVERLNLRILFIVQSNRKRRICNVERYGWSLDGSTNPLSMSMLPVLQYTQPFSHFVNTLEQIPIQTTTIKVKQ